MREFGRKHKLVLAAAVLWSAAAGNGCAAVAANTNANRSTGQGGTPRNTAGTSGLVLEQNVTPAVMAPGDTLHVTLTVRNPGDAPLAVRFTSGCLYGFGLWDLAGDGGGAILAPEPPMCTMNAPTVTFAPGESREQSFTWVWDGSHPAPGSYTVRAGLGPRGLREAAGDNMVRLEP